MATQLLIYLDESGDLGFDFTNKHPSFYFVITILVAAKFSTLKTAIKRTLKTKLNHSKKKRPINELKGSNTTLEIKQYFYKLLTSDSNWFIQAIILDQKKTPDYRLRTCSATELLENMSLTTKAGINALKIG